jgi:uncharacterized repeat protein (TIGR01451 family)
MTDKVAIRKAEKARLILIPSLLIAVLGFLLSSNSSVRPVHAFSSGPPAGYTGAPGEEPEACAECHVPTDVGSGHFTISAPATYVPGQTYSITVTHTNADPTRIRWGFELTVLDPSDEQAGNLQPLNGLTQVLNNAGPSGARQYIEHTAAGTFIDQQNTASWTFDWTAPSTDVGTVTFYAAGNQANNDGNTSGDYIYKTLVASAPFSATPDFDLAVAPSLRAVVPTAGTDYTTTITPSAGFTGLVNLSVTGLPAGASANFNPAAVNIVDAAARISTLTVTTTAGTPLGDYSLTVTAVSGSLMHSTPVTLKVISPASVDLAVSKSVSPNPGQVGVNLSYRVTVTNNGPAAATNVSVVDNLPGGVNFVSSSATIGSCSGAGPVTCAIGSLPANATAIVTIVVTPTTSGQLVNSATVSASETDNISSNNTASITTQIQPAPGNPSMLDPNLSVHTVLTGLSQPTGIALFGNAFFVLEKDTGRVKFVTNGVVQTTALDLAVNSASERGLLGIALHPNFAFNHFVYLYWTESSTGVDTPNLAEVPLLGNRVDRYRWNGSTLVFDRNVIKLRAYQADAGQPLRGNHNGGVLRFGPDGKLYILMGDNGRRGFLQNNQLGPVPDDQYGGPEPDDAHLTGAILRLHDDGSTPSDNPFFNVSTSLTGEAAANLKRLYAYGVRNGFGMAFDPLSGNLWDQENGDDSYDEMNRVTAGSNNGWIATMGPASRVADYKAIESTYGAGNLQQLRWSPSLIADTPAGALAQLYMLPGAHYNNPEFSWRYALAPSALGFVQGSGLGPQYEGDMLVGEGRTTLAGGFLFRFNLTEDRLHFSFSDSRLADLVADNTDKFDLSESESLLIGKDFGITTDIQTGPNGNVFVVSNTNGAVYEISGAQPLLFTANLTGAQETPPNNSTATGTATVLLSPDEQTARVSVNFSGLSSAQTDAHIHGPAAAGVAGPILFPLPDGNFTDFVITPSATDVQNLKNGLLYVNVHSSNFTAGEIRGQLAQSATAGSVQFSSASYLAGEGSGRATITLTRIGSTTAAASVAYATSDAAGASNCNAVNGNASARCDYTTTIGAVNFAAGETSRTVDVPITDDTYAEGNETFTVSLSNAAGATLGSPSSSTITITDNETTNGANPIDSADFFVHQHYIDFLNREPDPAGFTFWTNQITACGADPTCIEVKRINVSAAFFLSIEFQETGYLVYRTYKAAYGNLPGLPAPVKLNEFLPDTQQIDQGVVVGSGAWQAQLENNQVAFFMDFVSRSRFTTAYPTALTPAQFVEMLFANAGVTPSTAELNAAIGEFGGAGNTSDTAARARALRRVAENATLKQQETNRAFVLMQYFGYLRRNPNDAPEPGLNFAGYNFWLNKLNQFNGNFVDAEMVKAFLLSGEYRQRFGT